MTVALVLAVQPDAGLRGQLTALGVRRVDAAEQAGPGLLTVVAAARAAGERVLICVGDYTVPEEILTRLLDADASTVYTGLQPTGTHGGGALVVDVPDLDALAGAARSLAARRPDRPAPTRPAPPRPAPPRPSAPRPSPPRPRWPLASWARCSANWPGAGPASGSWTPDRRATARSRS